MAEEDKYPTSLLFALTEQDPKTASLGTEAHGLQGADE